MGRTIFSKVNVKSRGRQEGAGIPISKTIAAECAKKY
jgi:hypothetical protein